MKKGYFTFNDKFLGKCKLVNDILYFYNTNGDILFATKLQHLIEKGIIRIDSSKDTIEIFGVYNYIGYSGTFYLFPSIEDVLNDELTNLLDL